MQLAITALGGLIAVAGLAWTSGAVVRDNLEHWAAQWASELNELGAPFYLDDAGAAMLDVERFIAKYPEIERVTLVRPGRQRAALARRRRRDARRTPPLSTRRRPPSSRRARACSRRTS